MKVEKKLLFRLLINSVKKSFTLKMNINRVRISHNYTIRYLALREFLTFASIRRNPRRMCKNRNKSLINELLEPLKIMHPAFDFEIGIRFENLKKLKSKIPTFIIA